MIISKPNEEIPIRDFVKWKHQIIEKEIKSLSVDEIMGVKVESYVNMMVAKHSVFFKVYYQTERLFKDGQKEKTQSFENQYYRNMPPTYTEYGFILKYKYSGDIDVLRIEPECRRWSTLYNPIPIEVVGDELIIRFSATELNTKEIKKQIGEIKGNAFGNLDGNGGAIWHINLFNERLPEDIKKIFERIKAEKKKESDVYSELGIVNSSSVSIEVPIIKKVIPQPILIEQNKSIEYKLNEEIYRDILAFIYNLYKDYEQHQSIYKGRHEEELRDLIIPSLNSVYKSMNSSSETFNKQGKTDIITKSPDKTNIFIAECKIWHGEEQLIEAVDQLLRYVTWRDTRTAIIVFVKNVGITDIIEKAIYAVTKHSCYVSSNGQTNQSSFSFTFHIKEDKKCLISMELMFFHFPE